MLEITIAGNQGEGKTWTANKLSLIFKAEGKKVHIIEGFDTYELYELDKDIDVLIRTMQFVPN